MARNQRVGAWGEELAAREYQRQGYDIVERNWRCSDGELDLIVAKNRLIVIAEVKTRRNTRFGHPIEAITPAKQYRIHRLAARWRREHGIRAPRFRYDAVSVLGGKVQIHEGVL